MDDVEDNSELRRGLPVAHTVYGVPQTINTANYVYFQAIQELLKLEKSEEGLEGDRKGKKKAGGGDLVEVVNGECWHNAWTLVESLNGGRCRLVITRYNGEGTRRDESRSRQVYGCRRVEQ